VHVLDREPRRPVPPPGRYRSYRAPERPLPPGNATVAGMVARLRGGRLVLRTRRDGEKTVLLRDDTRYLSGGLEVPAGALEPGTLVFVRGARNFEDELEAYQVVWGEILRSGP
jgi:hypothetical protein